MGFRQTGERYQDFQIIGDSLLDPDVLDLNDYGLAIDQLGPMDLANRCGCHCGQIKLGEQLLWWLAKFIRDR